MFHLSPPIQSPNSSFPFSPHTKPRAFKKPRLPYPIPAISKSAEEIFRMAYLAPPAAHKPQIKCQICDTWVYPSNKRGCWKRKGFVGIASLFFYESRMNLEFRCIIWFRSKAKEIKEKRRKGELEEKLERKEHVELTRAKTIFNVSLHHIAATRD
jgi:hypothetical protein